MVLPVRAFVFSLVTVLIFAQSDTSFAQKSCEAFRRKSAPVYASIDDSLPPTAPVAKWTSMFPQIFRHPVEAPKRYIEQRRDLQAYRAKQVELEMARQRAIRSLALFSPDFPSLVHLMRNTGRAIENAVSITQIGYLEDRFAAEAETTREREQLRDENFTEYEERFRLSIDALRSHVEATLLPAAARKALLAALDSTEKKVRSQRDVTFAKTQLQHLSFLIRETPDDLEDSESIRRAVERRADVKSPQSASGILNSFKEVAQSVGIHETRLLNLDLAALVKLLEESELVRRFIYGEMQTARRYQLSAHASEHFRGILTRLRTDIEALEQSAALGKTAAIENLIRIRDAVTKVSYPENFDGLYPMRRPGAEARERLVVDVLRDERLEKALFGALRTIDIPVVPIEPKRQAGLYPEYPKEPVAPGRGARAWKAYQQEHQAFKNRFPEFVKKVDAHNQQLVADYQAELNYRTAVIQYGNDRSRAQAALNQRHRDRRVIQNSFVKYSPWSLLVSVEAIAEEIEEASLNTRERQLKTATQPTKKPEDTSSSSGGETIYYGSPADHSPEVLPSVDIPSPPPRLNIDPLPTAPAEKVAPADIQEAIDNGTEDAFDAANDAANGPDGDGGDGSDGGGD